MSRGQADACILPGNEAELSTNEELIAELIASASHKASALRDDAADDEQDGRRGPSSMSVRMPSWDEALAEQVRYQLPLLSVSLSRYL